jgi:hypothetical protein
MAVTAVLIITASSDKASLAVSHLKTMHAHPVRSDYLSANTTDSLTEIRKQLRKK